ncbi:unnamed protein product [Prunus brigantina]
MKGLIGEERTQNHLDTYNLSPEHKAQAVIRRSNQLSETATNSQRNYQLSKTATNTAKQAQTQNKTSPTKESKAREVEN